MFLKSGARAFRKAGYWALELASPTRCCGCERPGALVCEGCLDNLTLIDPVHACLHCAAPFGDLLCTECQRDAPAAPASGNPLDRCLAMATYEGPLPRIIRAYKDAGETRLAQPLAEMLVDTALHAEDVAPERYGGILSGADCLVFVPVTAKAYLRRGFDHMEAIAQNTSALAGVSLCDALAKHSTTDQRELDRSQRQQAQKGAYEVVQPVAGKKILLLDDVITTGATMKSAAAALKAAGAQSVDGLALARVW